MRKLFLVSCLFLFAALFSEEVEGFSPFTGKVVTNRVRLRTQPSLEGSIVKELQEGDLLLVDGNHQGFYQVLPTPDIRSYVFRTFVLDGVIEGSRVNVRLWPDLDSPIIAQLDSGYAIDGVVSAENSKWMEFSPPESVRFFVSEEFVESVGDVSFLTRFEERKSEAAKLLNTAIGLSQKELQKPFEEMDLNGVISLCKKVIEHYEEYADHVARAEEFLQQTNQVYLEKKLAYLEQKALEAERLAKALEQKEWFADKPLQSVYKFNPWQELERQNFEKWVKVSGDEKTWDDFIAFEAKRAKQIQGVIEPYARAVKNKPGDYVLVNKVDERPLAYLYSTEVNLEQWVGQEVELTVVPRPNNHFNHPAFFVLDLNR